MATGEDMHHNGCTGLTKKSFISIEKRIGQWWWDFLKDSIKEDGTAEKAIAKGTYHQGVLSVLLKALPPVCMEYTAQGECRVANIARGEAECYICLETLTKCCIFHTNKAAVL